MLEGLISSGQGKRTGCGGLGGGDELVREVTYEVLDAEILLLSHNQSFISFAAPLHVRLNKVGRHIPQKSSIATPSRPSPFHPFQSL